MFLSKFTLPEQSCTAALRQGMQHHQPQALLTHGIITKMAVNVMKQNDW
jgi:hypothetical protein